MPHSWLKGQPSAKHAKLFSIAASEIKSLGREAFAAWLPFWGVPFSYAVAVSYVLVDTADKGRKAFEEAQQELDVNNRVSSDVNTKRCWCQKALHPSKVAIARST